MTEHTGEAVGASGGRKGTKLARFALVPFDIIREVAEHYGRGARKYEDRNWQRGYPWSASYDALQRHLEAWWERGVERDDDPSTNDEDGTNSRHIIAVIWHAIALAWFSRHGVGEDDRPCTRFSDGTRRSDTDR